MESLISLPEAATVSEGSDKKIPEPSGEEDAEEWFMISTSSATVPEGSEEDEIHLHTTPRGSNIFSESVDTGTQLPEEELELGSAIGRRPVVSGTHTKVGEKMGTFLFEVLVTPGDVKLNKLLIPVEAALKCFSPPAECQETYKKKIKISDPQNFDWPMTLRYDPSECFFILENEWQIFAISNNVKSLDKIRFYKPVPHSDINHYLVETVKRRYPNAIHEFELENFMFQLPLTDMDIQHQRLIICPQDVFKHFSAVGIPARTHDIERLYFSDDLNVHFWDIKIGHYHGFYHLMLADFFTEYNLGKGDMISFYRPVHPLHSRHFLIAFVKGGGNPRLQQQMIPWMEAVTDRVMVEEEEQIEAATDRAKVEEGVTVGGASGGN